MCMHTCTDSEHRLPVSMCFRCRGFGILLVRELRLEALTDSRLAAHQCGIASEIDGP